MRPTHPRLDDLLAEAAVGVREYAGGDSYRLLLELLDLLECELLMRLASCKPEALAARQAQIAQLRALAIVLRGEDGDGRA